MAAVVLVVALGTPQAATRMEQAAWRDEIQIRLRASSSALGGRVTDAERAWLAELYAAPAVPVWLDSTARPSADAGDAIERLEHADRDGLDPAEYRGAAMAVAARDLPPGDAAAAAQFEFDLSLAVLRYLHDLHAGRVDPRAVGFRIDRPADVDLAGVLRDAVASHALAAAVADLSPHVNQYSSLLGALARYRALAQEPSANARLPLPDLVRPGDPLRAAAALYARLVALGDLPADVPTPAGRTYAPVLVEGVVHFQIRHGLTPDGVIGPRTREALSVPLAWRVRQIEMALERLRWLPPLGNGPVIALNIPMFHLWGWDRVPSDAPTLSLNAIVGEAFTTETPVFVNDMRYIVFRPYWNVPPSILRREMLPAIARDARVLEREHLEIVRGDGDATTVVPTTPASLRDLSQGTLRLRQRPGPDNALGLIKFVFPNDANVYMHGTPTPELFARSRRDFSHGCIRVEDPIALAAWALRGRDDWTPDAIAAATAGADDVRVDLALPIRVVIFYTTAAVIPEDGTVHFADDIYRLDAALDAALQVAGRAARGTLAR